VLAVLRMTARQVEKIIKKNSVQVRAADEGWSGAVELGELD
jgi:hypothetical protein